MEPEAFSPPPMALCGQLGLIFCCVCVCVPWLQVSCHFGVSKCLMGTKPALPPSSLPSSPQRKKDKKKEHLDVPTEKWLV